MLVCSLLMKSGLVMTYLILSATNRPVLMKTSVRQTITGRSCHKQMNENLHIAHKKLPHKTVCVHSARYTQCIHVNSCKLKLPKDTRTKKYKQLLPTHLFPKMELYIAVKCKIYSYK